MHSGPNGSRTGAVFRSTALTLGVLVGAAAVPLGFWLSAAHRTEAVPARTPPRDSISSSPAPESKLAPRQTFDTSGLTILMSTAQLWGPNASLEEVRQCWEGAAKRKIDELDRELAAPGIDAQQEFQLVTTKAICYLSDGDAEEAFDVLQAARTRFENRGSPAKERFLSSLLYLQGVAALRRGENENCILCRGESSCILPISAAAVHMNPEGSRLAIQHFSEYLEHFPNDLEARWLLNIAHMTLGQHPDQVDARYLLQLDRFVHSEVNIGRFRDIGHLVGLNRFNQAGGAIMEDFDNDGLLDIVVTSFDPSAPIGIFRNTGDGKFVECAMEAGVEDQLGGLICVQTDYNNDGLMDIFVARGAWLSRPIRPSLLRNDGGFHFTDVTAEAGLLAPVNSNAAAWADFDNDGWLDLFICCEQQEHRLYRNLGNGSFQEIAAQAGLVVDRPLYGKGCTWIDYDNDDFPDLFVNNLHGDAQLYHNNRNGTFTDVTPLQGVAGPRWGFACWAWDYDNDGWLDIFATSYDRTLGDVVKGLLGEPTTRTPNKLYRNLGGKRFQDVASAAGLDMVFATMGSNYGDFDNDGYLDMYLGTGEPNIDTLVPNRMFKNLAGHRFAEITGSAGVGHLQKGHGVACGDWDRDGNVDVFIDMGGPIPGDRYHNILFQNPGHNHRWLTLKLIGQKSNRAAIGARIKVVTASDPPLTVHHHVSSGSSFGSNPLQMTIGLADAEKIAELEIHWPTSGATQVFRDLAVNQAIEVTESAADYRILDWKPISWSH